MLGYCHFEAIHPKDASTWNQIDGINHMELQNHATYSKCIDQTHFIVKRIDALMSIDNNSFKVFVVFCF